MGGLTFLVHLCGIVTLITVTAYMVFIAILFSKIMLDDYRESKSKKRQGAGND
jgi:hypothetical protein